MPTLLSFSLPKFLFLSLFFYKQVGQAWHDSGLPREAVFLATKISRGESHGYAETKALVARQLKALQTDYIDLYYIHG